MNMNQRNVSDLLFVEYKGFGAEALFKGDVDVLPVYVILSVTNPLLRFTGGLHIYGGDFFETTCSQWNPERLETEPSDGTLLFVRCSGEKVVNETQKNTISTFYGQATKP